ncbi:hypothetical protein C9374_006909 [Naegleria lovaniensis]|uniref:Aminopeptidase P N-terminal domain-containing protein n=1 Tax=Naegleria lovaniensis TaxID=51637 RepID=A0AA88GYI1_NAELO|nr:uncharacterized protein C9374_006909 [Naegleria lovaniensis]KAG2393378.1 hypothetical protein C9374_006909 [Naegleria lovaniensis]
MISIDKIPYTYQVQPSTHSHLMKEDEIAPGFTLEEFKQRHRNLFNLMKENSVLILGSRKEYFMSPNVRYPYKQDSSFYYLSGVSEPDCFLVFKKTDSGNSITLYVREKSKKEFFHGVVNGVQSLQNLWGDYLQVKQVKAFVRDLQIIVKNFYTLYYDPDYDERLSQIIIESGGGMEFFKGPSQKFKIFYPENLIAMLRSIKSKAEIELTKRCAHISAQAFIELMKQIRPGMSEAHAEAILEFQCKIRGAQRLGYPPVVASGDRANIIHYLTNNHIMEDGDLIRIDGAAEYYGYMNDITRTFPVNGKFTPMQKKLYQAVLDIQKKCIDYLKKHLTETITINSFHEYSMCLTQDALAEHFNIGSGYGKNTLEINQLIEEVLYPHMIGHATGMNIHEDVPGRDDKLGPGMIITCEPGIYFSKQVKSYIPNPQLHGLGVQIEDDILLTENGIEILSHETPKEIEEIESIMSMNSKTPPISFSF